MGERAHGSVKKGQGMSEARQEGSTNGECECSTHTPPPPTLRKMHFSFPHIPVQRVLVYGVWARLRLGHGFGRKRQESVSRGSSIDHTHSA